MTLQTILGLLGLGLAAGALGGMLGIGGSVLMIPVLTLLLKLEHHVSQAVAMIVNVFVAVPAMVQHHRAKAVRWDVMGRMVPFGVVFIVVGVEASNHIGSERLEQVFGVFLLYVVFTNVQQLISKRAEPAADSQRINWPTAGGVGAFTGFMAGLLGVGGGIVAVPLLQRVCRLPLRQSIATTAAFMCISASVGAIRKSYTLAMLTDTAGQSLNLSWRNSVEVAIFLAPTAVIGGMFGGKLTHALPLPLVRVAFILLMLWASASMLGMV